MMDDMTRHSRLRAMWETSSLGGENATYLEALYEAWQRSPEAVPPEIRALFERFAPGAAVPGPSHAEVQAALQEAVRGRGRPIAAVAGDDAARQVRVLQLINAYRFRGYQRADTDPLQLSPRPELPELDMAHHGLTPADLDRSFQTGSLAGPDRMRLRDIIALLEATYCTTVGAEYMHITETREKRWLQQRLEGDRGRRELTTGDRLRILERLTAAEGLERYLHMRYVGQKRFSLEGADSLIPLIDMLIRHAGRHRLSELVMGMAHRGRLNILVNILGKTPAELFREFEGDASADHAGSGDVKYHMGFSSDIGTPAGPVHVALAFNPSHLEIVDPVVEGSARARQDRRGDKDGSQVLPVLIHGDAAFAGQGVVMETFNLSQTRGYSTKGTVHVVVNNQIGFTTSYYRDARSTRYCTDIAKMVDAPIFHVNGDDPEAVVFVARLALDYRMAFHKDVVIDLVCYRRHGHSEADEPTVTQPVMYRRIRERPTVRAVYARRLVGEGLVPAEEPQRWLDGYFQRLDAGESPVAELLPPEEARYPFAVDWKPYLVQACTIDMDTTVPVPRLQALWERLGQLPRGFELHPNVAKIFDNRRKMAAGALPVDWGFAETMAYASLVTEGVPVRLSGEDTARGTFFHRHAVVHNHRTGDRHVPLQHVAEDQAPFLVIDSPLSEEAVLAFEYGYSTTDPRTLVIWEAQFGDFANTAQVVIDQFISAGEQKWNRLSGLVLFLPHGYEGQGPEHSSARLERYLQLCAQHNMQVCVPTTPAQIFHLLRRQVLMSCRKPLVVMTPKSLLRHRLATSSLEDLAQGGFQALIPEVDPIDPRAARRLVLCSGKVYYDLLERRRSQGLADVAIVRIERLYPFPEAELRRLVRPYATVQDWVWCQEEPQNQGAWFAIQHHLQASLPTDAVIRYAGRPFSASPAVGYPRLHLQEQRQLVDEALGLDRD